MVLSRLLSVLLVVFFLSAPAATGGEKMYKTIFREDFSSEKVFSSMWETPAFSVYNVRGEPSMVANSDGINRVRLGKPENGVYPTGFIYAKELLSYGSYSARIKVSDTPGVVASFFACTEISSIFSDGTHDEIDFEFIPAKPDSVLLTTWRAATGEEGGRQTPTHNSFFWRDPSFDIRKWHVYRFDWHPDRVDFFIDGKKVWTSERAIPKRLMQIALHIYTIDTWDEIKFPPKGEAVQMTDWVEYGVFQ
jgi:hypothetical protein